MENTESRSSQEGRCVYIDKATALIERDIVMVVCVDPTGTYFRKLYM